MNSTDGSVISRMLSGDASAFSALVERHERRVFFTCYRVLRDFHAAEDCVQTSLALALEKRSQFRAETEIGFAFWLNRIAINAALSHLRKQRPRRTAEVSIDQDDAGRALVQLRDRRQDPEAACYQDEVRRLLWQKIETLSPRLRSVLVLRDLEELTTEETARQLGISVQVVKSRLLRAHRQMERKLNPLLRVTRAR